ncbi:TPA: efflux RND transporter permease subunit, partial [Acinetobacter baumannii]|nr:efflux RND transporter permease subunit [Acinetobacter baumannii]
KIYRPMLDKVLEYPKFTLLAALIVFILSLFPLTRLGGEFLPNMDEGDLLYMPSALPGLSAAKASELLQQTDRMIKTVPEVATVFGKAGRAESATDPAPLEMFETTIQFKPRSEWRSGMTPEKLVKELDKAVQVPGLTNIWVPPIRNRIDMLATGIKSPIGIKISASSLGEIDQVAQQVEQIAKKVPGVSSALAERLTGGRYVDVDINRLEAARYGLNINDIQQIVASAIGGENVGETVEGLARYPINVRYPREIRDSLEALRNLPILTESGQQIILSSVADIQLTDGPPMLKSENARPSGWVYVDVQGRDLASVVKDLKQSIDQQVKRSAGMSISYSGQFEFMERANARLKVVIPITLMIIFLLLYLIFRQVQDAVLIMVTLPFALIG